MFISLVKRLTCDLRNETSSVNEVILLHLISNKENIKWGLIAYIIHVSDYAN